MLDPNHTCLNVGLCRHVWVVTGSEVPGKAFFNPHRQACPRCDTNKHQVWVWNKIVGGDPKKRSQTHPLVKGGELFGTQSSSSSPLTGAE